MSYLLHGQNSLLVEERVARLRAEIDPTGVGANVIDLQSATAAEVAASCQAAPLFGARLVILRNPLNPTRKSAGDDGEVPVGRLPWPDVSAILTSAPPSNQIIIRQDGTLPSNHGAHKLAKELGWTVEQFRIPRGAELSAWTTDRAESLGARIAPDAVHRLLDLLFPLIWQSENRYDTASPDPWLIASELEKLASAAPEGVIDTATVDALVEDRGGYKAFALNDRLFGGQPEAALVELERVLAAGEPAERVIGQLASETAALFAVVEGGSFANSDVAAAAGISESRISTLKNKGPRPDATVLLRMAEAIRNADDAVKTGRAGDTQDAIVPLVAEMATAVRAGRRR